MCKFSLWIVLFFFVNIFFAQSQELDSKDETEEFGKRYNTILVVGAGYPFPSKSYEFFDTFSEHFGSERNVVKSSPLLYFSFKGEFLKGFRFGAIVEYYNLFFNESYLQFYEDSFEQGYRSISQDIQMNNLPIYFNFEYLPYSLPYKSYAGIGIGINLASVNWNEDLSSGLIAEKRKGGNHYNNTFISPSVKIYSGLELKFDRESVSSFVNSLVLELAFNYSYFNKDFFQNVRNQFTPIPEELIESYNIVPYTLALNLGVAFDFDPLKKK